MRASRGITAWMLSAGICSRWPATMAGPSFITGQPRNERRAFRHGTTSSRRLLASRRARRRRRCTRVDRPQRRALAAERGLLFRMTIPVESLPDEVRRACMRLGETLATLPGLDLVALWAYGAMTRPDRPRVPGDVDTHGVLG